MKPKAVADGIPVWCSHDEIVDIVKLIPNPKNPNHHPENQIDLGARIIKAHGWRWPIVVSKRSGFITKGHGRLLFAERMGVKEAPVDYQDYATEAEEWQDVIADNRLQEFAEPDLGIIEDILKSIESIDEELTGYNLDDFINESLEAVVAPEIEHRTLSEDFIVPPFSVLDARQGYWQERKKAWIAKGIKSEIGRGGVGVHIYSDAATIKRQGGEIGFDGSKQYKNGLLEDTEQARRHYKNAAPGGSSRTRAEDSHQERGDGTGKPMKGENGKFGKKKSVSGCLGSSETTIHGYDDGPEGGTASQSGTSIFDPVLCELVYRWFCPSGGAILDPFAGGSVRGIVAALLGHDYTGIDLRPEQIEANREQGDTIDFEGHMPRWIEGDSRDVSSLSPGEYDLIFSCPPYADLERYSDDPRDLSTLDYDEFIKSYREIIAASVDMLKSDRFACFVVGDIRDKKGFYRNFVSDTITAFQEAGATLYNEAVLVTAVGSLPIRVRKQFTGYRKLGKTHQNVLVFYKGDVKKIKSDFGEIDATFPEDGGNDLNG
jgi:DNA modification methylase